MLEKGIYEELINLWLKGEIENYKSYKISTDRIDSDSSSRLLSIYMAEKLERALNYMKDNNANLSLRVKFVNELLETINSRSGVKVCSEIINPPEMLLSVGENFYTGENLVPRPVTSIAYSSLFTGAISEPRLYSELKLEILTSDSIDMLVSFIKWSGLRLIWNELKSFTERGGKLRVITTTYMGATDIKSVEELNKLVNTEIKISYDTKNTRLHAKTYIFRRKTGYSTAYVGSSNLSNAAISGGLEWNVKVAGKDMPEMLGKIQETFNTYWHSDSFTEYTENQSDELMKALNKEIKRNQESEYIFDIKPYDYQSKILDELDADRKLRGNYRNLVVSATGTGKTVISAFDYARFARSHSGEF
jgi:HKD family nuclease